MTESQLSICTWADATFGVPASDASIAARALVEMAKLVTACVNGEPAARIGEEIADVVIVLARLGRSVEVDVIDLAQAWQALAGDGGGDTVVHAAGAAGDLGLVVQRISRSRATALTPLRRVVESLCDTAEACAIDLPSAIDAKMAINRTRRWKLDGNGHGSHVKEVTP